MKFSTLYVPLKTVIKHLKNFNIPKFLTKRNRLQVILGIISHAQVSGYGKKKPDTCRTRSSRSTKIIYLENFRDFWDYFYVWFGGRKIKLLSNLILWSISL